MKFPQRKTRSNTPKNIWREWLDSIVFAVVVATLIRGLLIEGLRDSDGFYGEFLADG